MKHRMFAIMSVWEGTPNMRGIVVALFLIIAHYSDLIPRKVNDTWKLYDKNNYS
ncbi:hypothetical protein GK047_13485 [Paenibacillus sp. SYP-B3998]|uniref:Uncharacterized protein n=1 Tax=Paenibacillus sp. SYP-B3998 TaxID=2678564 RepID=A0A6G3ZY93_9BACL|nr:hypothetical protein [Paenibacillus sp. SYP-B3998]NEW07018.1 hypothetical protein [Paenibacillus sp. SYP-B3998]